MKKLLSLLGIMGICSTPLISVVSCTPYNFDDGGDDDDDDEDEDGDTSAWEKMSDSELANDVCDNLAKNWNSVSKYLEDKLNPLFDDKGNYTGGGKDFSPELINELEKKFNLFLSDDLYHEIHYTIKRFISTKSGNNEDVQVMQFQINNIFLPILEKYNQAYHQLSSFFPLFKKWIALLSNAANIPSK